MFDQLGKPIIISVVIFFLMLGALNWMGNKVQEAQIQVAQKPQTLRKESALIPTGAPQRRNRRIAPRENAILNPLEVAREYLEENRGTWGIQEYHTLVPTSYRNPLGTTVKYDVYQDGIPVVGLSIHIRVGRNMTVKDVQNKYRPVYEADTEQRDTASVEEILSRVDERYAILNEDSVNLKPVLFVSSNSDQPELAFIIKARDSVRLNRGPISIVVSASDGSILGQSIPRQEF